MDNFVYIGITLIIFIMGYCVTVLFSKVSLFTVNSRSNFYKSTYVKNQQRLIISQFSNFFIAFGFGFICFISFTQSIIHHVYKPTFVNMSFLFVTTVLYIAGGLYLREGLRLRLITQANLNSKQSADYKNLLQTKHFYFHTLSNGVLQIAIYLYAKNISLLMLCCLNFHLIFIFISTIKYVSRPYIGEEIMAFMLKATSLVIVCMTFSSLFLGIGDKYYFIVMATQALVFLTWSGCLLFLIMSDNAYLHYKNSVKDNLTGLYNRRYFSNRLKHILETAISNETALIICDIDDFKKINDNYGHDVGDTAIAHFAKVLKAETREQDVVARIGGEEFAVILPKTSLAEAYEIAEKIRTSVQVHKVVVNNSKETVQNSTEEALSFEMTGSFGVTAYVHSSKNLLMKHADMAMYRAKELGKNRVEMARFTA